MDAVDCQRFGQACRLSAYGVPGYFIEDGNDVIAVYETFKKAVEHVRAGNGPVLVESIFCRCKPMARPICDRAFYVRTLEAPV